jgi:hypothetical protein
MSLFKRWRQLLFDFSEGERRQAELASIVQAALDRSRTSEEFEEVVYQLLDTGNVRRTPSRFRFLMSELIEFRLPGESPRADMRAQAERYVQFLHSMGKSNR